MSEWEKMTNPSTAEKIDRVEVLLRSSARMLKEIHDELYKYDTDEMDEVADEFDLIQGEIEFGLKELPATVAKAKKLLAEMS